MIRFVVVNENILGYVDPSQPNQAGVLASSVIRGASHSWKDGPYPLRTDGRDVRPATRQDFMDFRVEPTGYRNDPAYAFPAE
jgi:hypothetical protein